MISYQYQFRIKVELYNMLTSEIFLIIVKIVAH